MITRYHAKYYASLLTQQSVGDNLGSLSQSLLNASVDINPHQIEAALFAFKSPYSKGVVLADEVGLGKTIEAGLIMCQYWAIGKRKIIVVCPASLRKQWCAELQDKFGIESEILDGASYNKAIMMGRKPLNQKKVLVCSYHFAGKHKDDILLHCFDLAVIDEAHKLRNVYRSSAKTSSDVRDALSNAKKLLLTATPFQNSLMELYGLTTVIDMNFFGTEKQFRAKYGKDENYAELRDRIRPLFKRTLRKDVKEYINYTERHAMTQAFESSDQEFELYNKVSEFLRRDDLYSIPVQQKKLITMVVRKILASSTFALISTLTKMRDRLVRMYETETLEAFHLEDLTDDYLYDYEEEEDIIVDGEQMQISDETIDKEKLKKEIAELNGFIEKAKAITVDTKSEALLKALKASFKNQYKGEAHKALIFTESTKTQAYLYDYLVKHGYEGRVILFNGKSGEKQTTEIYQNWVKAHPNKVSGVKSADRRAAIVDYFEHKADIMLATEAASEGLNLQFCSLVINYDMPWNPQRIEQRIGRCHRYGQKFDVVVVNFLNKRNYADVHVLELLTKKFNLFDGVFGVSDEVIGEAENFPLEDRIFDIYQRCRTKEEIDAAFNQLREDMQSQIDVRMEEVRNQVLENFDINVQEHLRLANEDTRAFLNRYEHIFWELTRFILSADAVFDDANYSFMLRHEVAGARKGLYQLFSRATDGIPYRLSSRLGQHVINTALSISLDSDSGILFDENALSIQAILPDYLKAAKGYLILSQMNIKAENPEQRILFNAFTEDGRPLSQDDCEKLFLNGGMEVDATVIPDKIREQLQQEMQQHCSAVMKEIDDRNFGYFKEEEKRITDWEKDVVEGLEHEIDTIKRSIRDMEAQALRVENFTERIAIDNKVLELKQKKRKLRNELDDREEEVAQQRKQMIREAEKRINSTMNTDDLFVIQWSVK